MLQGSLQIIKIIIAILNYSSIQFFSCHKIPFGFIVVTSYEMRTKIVPRGCHMASHGHSCIAEIEIELRNCTEMDLIRANTILLTQ